MFKLRTLQQSMELEELEHKATNARLADKNKIDQSIEEANSEALKGETGSSWGLNASELKYNLKIYSLDHTTNKPIANLLLMVFFPPFFQEMESTLQEERSLKMQVEAKLLQLKKEHSMLDCDYKQAKQKLDELQAQKERLSEEVGPKPPYYVVIFHSFTTLSNPE